MMYIFENNQEYFGLTFIQVEEFTSDTTLQY